MKYLHLMLLGLLILQPSYADSTDADSTDMELEYDQVGIGYIPSRYASRQGVTYTTLEAKALRQYGNEKIGQFFAQLRKIASDGITDNATRFHKPTRYIEATFQGKSVRLLFVGDSDLDKFRDYEEGWKVLHKELFEYLIQELSPDKAP